jgi:hypothetical protein
MLIGSSFFDHPAEAVPHLSREFRLYLSTGADAPLIANRYCAFKRLRLQALVSTSKSPARFPPGLATTFPDCSFSHESRYESTEILDTEILDSSKCFRQGDLYA